MKNMSAFKLASISYLFSEEINFVSTDQICRIHACKKEKVVSSASWRCVKRTVKRAVKRTYEKCVALESYT